MQTKKLNFIWKVDMLEIPELKELLSWRMCSDPFPYGVNQYIIDDFLDKISQQFGFENWIDAYHNL